jgi:hypothetical protein
VGVYVHSADSLASFTANWYVSSDVDTDDGEVWEFRESGAPAGIRTSVDLPRIPKARLRWESRAIAAPYIAQRHTNPTDDRRGASRL